MPIPINFQAIAGFLKGVSIAAPKEADLKVRTENGKLIMEFVATNQDGRQQKFRREYAGEKLNGDSLTDLLQWLQYTAKTFGLENTSV